MGEDKYLQKGNLEHERGAITCMYGAKEKLFRLKTWQLEDFYELLEMVVWCGQEVKYWKYS